MMTGTADMIDSNGLPSVINSIENSEPSQLQSIS